MSNLMARAGDRSFDANPGGSQRQMHTVQVSDLATPLATVASDSGDDINLRELWRALCRRKRLFGVTSGAVLLASAAVTVYQRLVTPVYQGSFSLLITDPISNDESKRQGGDFAAAGAGSMFESLARNTTSNDIPTLIEVLRSPVLLSPIAKQFGLNTKALASRIQIASPGEKRIAAQGVLNVTLTGRKPTEDQRLLEALSQAYLQAALQQRQQRLADGLAFLNKQAPAIQARTAELHGELATFRERHNLLEPTEEGVALKTRVAELDAQVLGLQAERARLQRVRKEIASGSLSARGFQEAIGTGSGSSTGGSQGDGLSVSDPDQSLLQELLNGETELAQARSKYSPSSSMVKGLEERLRQLQPLLRQNQLGAVDAALSLNAGRLATAKRQQSSLNAQFLRQPGLIKQYDALQQNLTIAQNILTGLVSARENFQLEIAQRSVPWRVIAPPAMNPNPIKPSVPGNLATGLVLGLLAGAGAGLLRDRLDHVFHHPGEVKDDLGLPLLGHIPHVEFFKGVREDKRFLLQELDRSVTSSDTDADERKRQRYQRFFYQEAFRNLYTSLRFLNSDRPLKSLALTSSLPAEGKSLVNVLLAKTLSEMGQRVLLIDADLRKPQMHHRLGINNLAGLSNLLIDDGQHWRQVVQSVAGYDNWSVITAGRQPPDPTRLLSSQRMHQLVAELTSCGAYDLVLFDTPPVLGLADAALVAEHCDGLMLLVSLGRVDRALPREAVNRIRSSGVPLLGVVTNSVKEASQSSSADGYGGAYGYGGYGYAAYDTSSAYAYYAETETSNEATTPSAANSPIRNHPIADKITEGDTANYWRQWRDALYQRQRAFLRWLDR